MKKMFRMGLGLGVAAASVSPAAMAQTPAVAAPPPAPATTAPPPDPPVPPAQSAAREAPEAESEAPMTDHDRFVKRLGVTYFDIASLPIANPLGSGGSGSSAITPGGITSSTVQAPVVGARYWFRRTMGVDLGLGLGLAGGSQEAVSSGLDTKVGKVGTVGVAFHAGLPILLHEGSHYAFLVIPEFTIGSASGKLTVPGVPGGITSPEQDLSGFLFDGGVKVGAEIYFGFIGLPELALQATVGLSYRRSVFKLAAGGDSASDGTSTFGTNVGADPWAIFANDVSATYYF